jgi:hypothetical protein
MRHGLDSISLVTRDRHTAFSATWADIKTWSADSNVASTLGKINASAKHRKVFNSVRAPAVKAATTASEEETVALIRALQVIPLEFQRVPSSTELEARDLASRNSFSNYKGWGFRNAARFVGSSK